MRYQKTAQSCYKKESSIKNQENIACPREKQSTQYPSCHIMQFSVNGLPIVQHQTHHQQWFEENVHQRIEKQTTQIAQRSDKKKVLHSDKTTRLLYSKNSVAV